MSFSIQKATLWKRFSAFLFDFILTAILSVGIMLALSSLLQYDGHSKKLQGYYDEIQTKIEEEYSDKYGFALDLDYMDSEGYEKLTEEEKAPYEEANEAYEQALNDDERVAKKTQVIFFLTLVMVSVGFLLGIMTIHFIVPLFLKNGQTLGKKIFGTAVMRSNGVKISNFVLFVRAIFGVYAIETLFPIALLTMLMFGLLGGLGSLTIILLLGLQLGLVFFTRYRTTIHDLLSDTVVVDMACQRIFDTQEEMLEDIKKEKAEEAQKRDYI